MRSLTENLCKDAFDAFISAHMGTATHFSLSKNRWSEADASEEACVLKALAPYYIKTIQTNRWFCEAVPEGQRIEAYLFSFTAASREILLAHYDSIFYVDTVWKKLEDICFFKNQVLISGSVTHENICFVYDETLQLPGNWEILADKSTEQIHIVD